jgi:hypothetical protein
MRPNFPLTYQSNGQIKHSLLEEEEKGKKSMAENT